MNHDGDAFFFGRGRRGYRIDLALSLLGASGFRDSNAHAERKSYLLIFSIKVVLCRFKSFAVLETLP